MLLYAMAQSLSHLIVHAVFSTKDRRALLRSEEIRSETYSYMAGIFKNLQCHPIKIGGADDRFRLTNHMVGAGAPALGSMIRISGRTTPPA